MTEAVVEQEVPVAADLIWARLRDFGDVSWIPGTSKVEVDGEGPGMRRRITGSTGHEPVLEQLLTLDDASRTLEYRIEANNPLPVTSYRARIVVGGDDERATVQWTATYEPAGEPATADKVIHGMLGALIGWLVDATGA